MIHILHHQTDDIIGWISQVKGVDSHQQSITNEETYNFIVSVDEPFSGVLTSRSRILIPSEEGDYREFIINHTYENTANRTKEVYCIGSFVDIRKSKVITPQVMDGQTVETACSYVLDGL